MSQPFYMGDLSGCQALEATIDAITNYSVDGASDFLASAAQLAHLDEMKGLTEQQDKTFWYRLGSGEAPPARNFAGFVLAPADAARLAAECPEALDGKRMILTLPEGGDEAVDVAAVACTVREHGVTELAVQVAAERPEALLETAMTQRAATGLPLHLAWRREDGEAVLEEISMALGWLLEKGWVQSVALAGLAGTPGSGYARSLFNALELKRFGINYVSCPTCGRCRVDLEAITNEVKERTKDVTAPLTVAIMGCEVNGPGEARHADIGIASGTESGLLIRDGEAVAKYSEKELVDVLVEQIHGMVEQMEV